MKLLLRRDKALGTEPSRSQLSPSEVALVNSVPGVPLRGCSATASCSSTVAQQLPESAAIDVEESGLESDKSSSSAEPTKRTVAKSSSSRAGPTTATVPSSKSAGHGIPIDWEWYDQFRKETSTPGSYLFDVFNEEGKKISQIQPFPFTDGYKAAAACYHLGHKDGCKKSRCARIRSWKPDKGELPMHVDRVLIRWLIDGQKQLNKANHQKLHRH